MFNWFVHKAVGNHLLKTCQDFEDLLDSTDVNEGRVQEFLEQKQHHFLLLSNSKSVHPQKPLNGGKYKPDFALVRPDGDWHLIEIENTSIPIYQKSGQERSAHLSHAETQANDWLRYIDEFREAARRVDGFEGIYKPTGEVVAGRDKHLGEDATKRFHYERANNSIA